MNINNLDVSVRPADDFYQYACGGWMKAHPLKPEFARFGMFDYIRENAREQLRELIVNLKSHPEAKVKDSLAQKISDLYEMGMDSERREREGVEPIRPLLNHIDSGPLLTKEERTRALAWLHDGIDGGCMFSTGVGPDARDASTNAMHIGEGGLGLGDRDYYLIKNEEHAKIMAAYEVFVKRLIQLAGYSDEEAEATWEAVMKIEPILAEAQMPREKRRDPAARYHKRTYADLKAEFPAIDWDLYFSLVGADMQGVESVILTSPDFMKASDEMLSTMDSEQLRRYIRFNAIASSTGVLSEAFSDADFELYGRVMSGAEEKRPLWKRAMTFPNSMLGEAVGQLYVEKYFPAEHKRRMVNLVENLRQSLGKHISGLSWMSDATKQRALEKLNRMTVKIGYPDKWKDYSEIHIDPERSYAENVLEASRWYTRDNFADLHKPVDRTKWYMTPQTVNAYYSPINNEICFPAAILQPPYFDPDANPASNYGAIGVVIGHEMTHGFDDSGRKFDADGNLNEWWTEEDARKFTEKADRLVAQFDAIEVAPGVHANGRYTLGENIADQGGLRVALTAWRDECAGEEAEIKAGEARPGADGFTPLQEFFLSYAGVWAGNIRPEEILSATKTDPHSLGRWRVNATLRNIVEFFEAFSIGASDPMYLPESERTIIW